MRGVEVGSIGRGVLVAPAVGRAGIGPSVGRPSFGLEGGISARSIANPFPPSFLEPNIGIIRNPEAKVPSQTISIADTELPSGPEAVEIAEKWLGISKPPQVSQPEATVIPSKTRDLKINLEILHFVQNDKRIMPLWARPAILPFYQMEPVVEPKNELKIQPKAGQIEFSNTAPRGAVLTELNKKSIQEDVVGQNFEKEIQIEEKIDEKPQVWETEEIEEQRLKDLLDEEVAEQRIYEISQAIDQVEVGASGEGKEEIDGSLILKLIRLHLGLISQIARKIRKDGSLDETLEELAARRFSSKKAAKEQTKQLVFEKEPVRRGKEGKAVKEGAVERVLKYHFVKRSPKDEVVAREVKKHQAHRASPYEAASVPVAVPEGEKRIEDYQGLAEIFKKAA